MRRGWVVEGNLGSECKRSIVACLVCWQFGGGEVEDMGAGSVRSRPCQASFRHDQCGAVNYFFKGGFPPFLKAVFDMVVL